ncbi:MAG: response regulator [Candidatus Sumerlaeia bacterium]|nr:response regulator [Candidatus Sumerlaeia bacterium]
MSQKTILCVDDERDILLILQTALSDDYTILTANSGAKALEVAKATRPDLVILDLMMPEMDGLQTFAEFKKVEKLADVPCIFLTGVSDKEKIREALLLGTKYYLTKPFELDDLMEKVSMALQGADFSF